MARVLVVYPPVSLARDFIDYPHFADLGAVQLAAVLRARGDDVTLVDAYALPSSSLTWRSDGRAHLGAPIADVVARFGDPDVAVVAYTPFHRPPTRDDVLGPLLASLRAALGDRRIVLADLYQSGQHYVEADGASVLASYPEVDAWVKYEGEVSVPAIVADPGARGVVRGIEVPSLDELPPPAWDLVDLEAADRFRGRLVANLGRGPWAFPIDGRTLPMVTSRGCPFRCAHCSSNPGREDGAPKTQRRLSVGVMRANLERLVRVHRATRVEVLDELLNVNERHFDAFLEIVAALDLKLDVPNGMRADYLERRHLHAMRGRVATVSVSAESGVQRVVNEVVGKQLDLREIERVAADAHAEGGCAHDPLHRRHAGRDGRRSARDALFRHAPPRALRRLPRRAVRDAAPGYGAREGARAPRRRRLGAALPDRAIAAGRARRPERPPRDETRLRCAPPRGARREAGRNIDE